MHLPWVLLLLCVCGPWLAGGQAAEEEAPRPGERDALCHAERGCYALFVQRKTFREAGRSCREHGGTLATLHSERAAAGVHRLLAGVEPRGGRARLRLWVGLHRGPRQCSATRPLRGFVWVTGDQEGKYTNWLREEAPGACLGPRCVALTVHTSDSSADNYRWLDGACGLALDGYVCQYHFKGMCSPLEAGPGSEAPRYTTPFRLTSTLLTHVPFGSVAAARCPADPADPAERTALCVEQEDGGVGWSAPLVPCSSSSSSSDDDDDAATVPQHQEDQEDQEQDWCQGDHGCQHHCQLTEHDYTCFCSVGFTLDQDGYGCTPDGAAGPTPTPTHQHPWPETSAPPRVDPACVEAGCQYDCVETARGVRCTCPPGYQVGRDGRGCADVDECRQRPCLQQCVNTPGTFHCACYAGYRPDDEGECVDVDECLDEASCPGGCQNSEGSYACSCDSGYQQGGDDGGECVDVDECAAGESPCQQHCLNFVGGFVCYCQDGYSLHADGVTCDSLPEDEEYSTLTPDPADVAREPRPTAYHPPDGEAGSERERPWFTSHTPQPHFEHEPHFSSDWLTEPPGESAPNAAPPHGADGHLNPWEGRSPGAHHTAPPPTPRHGRPDEGETRAGAANTGERPDARAGAEAPDPSGSRPGGVAKVGAGGSGEAQAGEDTGEAESNAGKRKQDKSWLLVALLVPLCVFLVVMLALGIVYCTSCAVDKSQSFSDCYRWVLPATPPVTASNGKPQA